MPAVVGEDGGGDTVTACGVEVLVANVVVPAKTAS
jgi:hypothetical protein